jgi:hypothetical protein
LFCLIIKSGSRGLFQAISNTCLAILPEIVLSLILAINLAKISGVIGELFISKSCLFKAASNSPAIQLAVSLAKLRLLL